MCHVVCIVVGYVAERINPLISEVQLLVLIRNCTIVFVESSHRTPWRGKGKHTQLKQQYVSMF